MIVSYKLRIVFLIYHLMHKICFPHYFMHEHLIKSDLKQSNSFFVPIFMDNENYFLEILYLDNEILETKWGR